MWISNFGSNMPLPPKNPLLLDILNPLLHKTAYADISKETCNKTCSYTIHKARKATEHLQLT